MNITDSMKDSVLYEGQVLYSDRATDSFSNRSLLAGALETAVQNDIERTKLEQYKQKIDLINSEEKKLRDLRAQIKTLSFQKGPRDTEALKNLQFEANRTANRINVYDRQLLDLESTKALKGVLEREKKRAYQKAEKRGKEALARQKEKYAEAQKRNRESRLKDIDNRHRTAMRHKIDDETASKMVSDFYDELNAAVYGFQQGGFTNNPEFDLEWVPNAFHDFDAYIRELSDIHEQYKAEIRAKKSESATVEDENYDVNDTDVQEQSRGYLDGYTNEEYNHFGWARADGILTAQENARLRSLFAETVSGQANPPKTKFGEYMIAIGDGVDNKIAYMKGEIDSPVITHILKINSSNETELDAIRRETYALERRGIQRTAGGIFDVYSAASGRGANHEQRIGIQSEHHNDRFGSERGRSSFEIERIKEILFDEDGKEITRTYAQDVQYQQRTETLTDREILEMAANEIDITDLSEAEQSALTIFQNRLSDLKDLQEKRVEQGRLYGVF